METKIINEFKKLLDKLIEEKNLWQLLDAKIQIQSQSWWLNCKLLVIGKVYDEKQGKVFLFGAH